MTSAAAPSSIARADFAGPVRLHYRRAGTPGAKPLLLLHGWPEFSRVWEPVMQQLAGAGYDLIAPDFRGFGDSEKPDGERQSFEVGPDVHAADLTALIEGLGLGPVGIVAHDVGAYVAQTLARLQPKQLSGLFFFNCPHPGVGRRWGAPGHLSEIWYQSFHLQPIAAELISSSRGACRAYLRHFLTHWAGRKEAFDAVLEEWVDNFLQPGNLQGGFNWYISTHANRIRTIEETLPPQPPIALPTCVRWGSRDPVLPVAWADTLDRSFSRLDFRPLPGLGHFAHWEDPETSAAEIRRFFDGLR